MIHSVDPQSKMQEIEELDSLLHWFLEKYERKP